MRYKKEVLIRYQIMLDNNNWEGNKSCQWVGDQIEKTVT
jgi:hypothetical protein